MWGYGGDDYIISNDPDEFHFDIMLTGLGVE